jgi:hypothetical protein
MKVRRRFPAEYEMLNPSIKIVTKDVDPFYSGKDEYKLTISW